MCVCGDACTNVRVVCVCIRVPTCEGCVSVHVRTREGVCVCVNTRGLCVYVCMCEHFRFLCVHVCEHVRVVCVHAGAPRWKGLLVLVGRAGRLAATC